MGSSYYLNLRLLLESSIKCCHDFSIVRMASCDVDRASPIGPKHRITKNIDTKVPLLAHPCVSYNKQSFPRVFSPDRNIDESLAKHA
jgi:hypothetical protein